MRRMLAVGGFDKKCAAYAIGDTLVVSSLSGSINTKKFDAAVTGMALAPISKDAASHSLMVTTDDKKLFSFVADKDGLTEKQSTVLSRRSHAISFLQMPPNLSADPVLVVGDKVGDVTAYGMQDIVGRKRFLLGHTASIITCVEGCGENNGLLLTADRDEKIRVSHWPNPYLVSSFCLGHTRFISSLATVRAAVGPYKDGELFVSAGGDGTLRIWHAASGTLLHTVYLRPSSSVSPLKYTVEAAEGSHDEGKDMVTSQVESTGGVQDDVSSTSAEKDDNKRVIPDTALDIVLNRVAPAIVPLGLTVFSTSEGTFVAFFIEGEAAIRIAAITLEKDPKKIPTPSGQSEKFGDALDQVRLVLADSLPLQDNHVPYSLQSTELNGQCSLVLGALDTNNKTFGLQSVSVAGRKLSFADTSTNVTEMRQINETFKTITASAFPEDTDFTKICASPMTAFPQDYDKIYIAERGKTVHNETGAKLN